MSASESLKGSHRLLRCNTNVIADSLQAWFPPDTAVLLKSVHSGLQESRHDIFCSVAQESFVKVTGLAPRATDPCFTLHLMVFTAPKVNKMCLGSDSSPHLKDRQNQSRPRCCSSQPCRPPEVMASPLSHTIWA